MSGPTADERQSLWPDQKRCAISICFDDGRPCQPELAVPLLDQYRLPATFYLNTEHWEDLSPEALHAAIDPWLKIRDAGHEIGNHTRLHPCSTNILWTEVLQRTPLESMSLADIQYEIDSAQTLLQGLGFTPKTFAYPCGLTFVGRGLNCTSYVPEVAKRFLVGRTYNDECSAAPLRCDLARIPAAGMDGKTTEDVIRLIDNARDEETWQVLVSHHIVHAPKPDMTSIQVLDEVLGYLSGQGDVWVDTVEHVGSRLRAVQAGGRRQ